MSDPVAGARLQGVGVETDDNGRIQLAPDAEIWTSGPIRPTDHGLSFGPLRLQSRGTTDLQRAELMPSRTASVFGDGGGSASPILGGLLVAGLGSEAADEEARDRDGVTRRGLLAAATAATGLYALGSTAAEQATLPVMEFEVLRNDGGLRVVIDALVEGILPSEQTYSVVANGTEVGTFVADGRDGVSLPPQLTGEISVHTDADSTFFENVRALVSGNTLQYEFELSSPAAAFEPESDLTITEHPVVVEAVRQAGHGGSAATIGDVSIPHRDENSSSADGWYAVTGTDNDDTVPELTYHVGTDAPDGSVFEVRARVGSVDELLDDINRRV